MTHDACQESNITKVYIDIYMANSVLEKVTISKCYRMVFVTIIIHIVVIVNIIILICTVWIFSPHASLADRRKQRIAVKLDLPEHLFMFTHVVKSQRWAVILLKCTAAQLRTQNRIFDWFPYCPTCIFCLLTMCLYLCSHVARVVNSWVSASMTPRV